MTDKIPSNLYEIVELFARDKEIEMTSQKIRNLRSTIKKCLKHAWSFSDKEWKKIDECLKNISSDEFMAKAPEEFYNFYNQALIYEPESKAMLGNNKSDFEELFGLKNKSGSIISISTGKNLKKSPKLKLVKALMTTEKVKEKMPQKILTSSKNLNDQNI
jgi:hypothetical protein